MVLSYNFLFLTTKYIYLKYLKYFMNFIIYCNNLSLEPN